jgi:hypothetical protein
VAGPATLPSGAMAQARDSTPKSMTAVTMCALAVQNMPVQRGRPSSSSHSLAASAFSAFTETSIGTTLCLLPTTTTLCDPQP